MDQQQIERIHNPQFPLARRGYEQREVDHFMLGLAEWLEGGGLDEAGSFAVIGAATAAPSVGRVR